MSEYFQFLQLIWRLNPVTIFDVMVVILGVVFIRQERSTGFKQSVLNMLRVIGVLVLTLVIYPVATNFLWGQLHLAFDISRLVVLIVLFSGLYTVVYWLLKKFFMYETDIAQPSVLSMIVGVVTFGVFVTCFVTVIAQIPLALSIKSSILSSPTGVITIKLVQTVDHRIQRFYTQNTSIDIFAAITSSQSSEVPLYMSSSHQVPPQQVLTNLTMALYNWKRIKNDMTLNSLAQTQAQDVAQRGSLTTLSSTGFNVYDRLLIGGVSYTDASEIVIYTPSISTVLDVLKNNRDTAILFDTQSTYGVGVVQLGSHGYIIVIDLVR